MHAWGRESERVRESKNEIENKQERAVHQEPEPESVVERENNGERKREREEMVEWCSPHHGDDECVRRGVSDAHCVGEDVEGLAEVVEEDTLAVRGAGGDVV